MIMEAMDMYCSPLIFPKKSPAVKPKETTINVILDADLNSSDMSNGQLTNYPSDNFCDNTAFRSIFKDILNLK